MRHENVGSAALHNLDVIPSADLSTSNAVASLSADGSMTVICTASSALKEGAIFKIDWGTEVSVQ